jgi:hypothetical protein
MNDLYAEERVQAVKNTTSQCVHITPICPGCLNTGRQCCVSGRFQFFSHTLMEHAFCSSSGDNPDYLLGVLNMNQTSLMTGVLDINFSCSGLCTGSSYLCLIANSVSPGDEWRPYRVTIRWQLNGERMKRCCHYNGGTCHNILYYTCWVCPQTTHNWPPIFNTLQIFSAVQII